MGCKYMRSIWMLYVWVMVSKTLRPLHPSREENIRTAHFVYFPPPRLIQSASTLDTINTATVMPPTATLAEPVAATTPP